MRLLPTTIITALLGITSYACKNSNANQTINSSNGIALLENSLPISIGNSKTQVNQALGTPTRSGDDFESYYLHRLVINYNTSSKVKSITATTLNSGVTFRGKIFGVAIGDDVIICTSSWGNPVNWTETSFEYNIGKWVYQGYTFELEIWSKDGVDSGFGQSKTSTVKRIKIE